MDLDRQALLTVFFYECQLLITFLEQLFFIFVCRYLNQLCWIFAHPSRNWYFKCFAREAEKKRSQRNKHETWHSLGYEPRPMDYRADVPTTEQRCLWKILNINPYWLSNLQLIPQISFLHMDNERHVLITVFFGNVHCWFYFTIVIFHNCMSLFQSPKLSFCKPQSKLDLPTLRQCSRETNFATEQIKNMILARIRTQANGSSRRCSSHWDMVSLGRSWF